VGYRQMVDHVTAQVPLEETREKVIQATRRYARRQRTWFASEPGFHWNALPAELLTPTGFGRVKAALRKPG
jgi:tRNA dimethylallyltransferase